jgi:Cytochrome c oxidase biogenesis protein Cmc1 like
VKLTTRKCRHHDWLNSVKDDSADYPIVCDSYSDNSNPETRVVRGNASQYIGIIAQGGGECQGSTRDEMQSCLSAVSGRYSLRIVILIVDFTECATGRTVSMAWACRQKRRRMMECIQA